MPIYLVLKPACSAIFVYMSRKGSCETVQVESSQSLSWLLTDAKLTNIYSAG